MNPLYGYGTPVGAPMGSSVAPVVPMMAPQPAVTMAPPPKPYAGTLPPGTKVVVGKYVVTVQRYLAEGGFAHVYLVTSQEPVPIPSVDSEGRKVTRPETTHVLKRMSVPDKQNLALVRGEVEAHVCNHSCATWHCTCLY